MRGMLSASQVRARVANSSTDSVVSVGAEVVSVMMRAPALGEVVDPQIVVFWRAEHRAVQRDSPQVQVQVVFPRHTDAAVQLDAVLQHAEGHVHPTYDFATLTASSAPG